MTIDLPAQSQAVHASGKQANIDAPLESAQLMEVLISQLKFNKRLVIKLNPRLSWGEKTKLYW